MDDLELDVKRLIVEALMLDTVRAEEIDSEQALFKTGLGLDSIDALELAMAIERRYGVRLRADDENNRSTFASVRALAAHVAAHRTR